MFKKLFNIVKEFAIGKVLHTPSIKSSIILTIRTIITLKIESCVIGTNKLHGAYKALATVISTGAALLWTLR